MTAPIIQKIQHTDPAINRQTDEIIRAVNPVLTGSSVPDPDWKALTLNSPWTSYDIEEHAQLSYRTLANNTIMVKGAVSTIGGSSKAPAFSKAATSAANTLVKVNAAICTLPAAIASKEYRFMPLMFATGWTSDHKFFIQPCYVSLVPATSSTPAQLQFQGVMSIDNTAGVAIDELSLELNWMI